MNSDEKVYENNSQESKVSLKKSSQHLTKGVISNFLRTYGIIPISLLITWSFGKNLSAEFWKILTYTLIFINGSQIILNYIPPSVGTVIIVIVPEKIIHNKHSEVKGLINYVITVKLIFSFVVWVIYLIISISWLRNSETYIQGICAIIYSPNIILIEFKKMYANLFSALKIFMARFYLFLSEKLIILTGNIIIFYLFNFKEKLELFLIVGLNLFSIIPSIIIFFIFYQKKFRQYPKERTSWKDIKNSVKYGIHFTINSSMDSISNQIFYGILNNQNDPNLVNEYNLGNNLVGQTQMAFSMPLTPILVDLETSGKRDAMLKLYRKSVYFINLILALLTGLLFYGSELYVLIIYPPEFLEFVDLLKFYLLVIYFQSLINNYNSLYATTHKEKRMVKIRIYNFIFTTIITLISFYVWGFAGFIISQMIGKLIYSLSYWFDGKYILKEFKIHFLELYRHILIILLIYAINTILFQFIQKLFNFTQLINLVLNLLEFLNHDLESQVTIIISNMIQIFTFLLIFLSYIIFFKGLTKNHIKSLENVNIKIPLKKLWYKILK